MHYIDKHACVFGSNTNQGWSELKGKCSWRLVTIILTTLYICLAHGHLKKKRKGTVAKITKSWILSLIEGFIMKMSRKFTSTFST